MNYQYRERFSHRTTDTRQKKTGKVVCRKYGSATQYTSTHDEKETTVRIISGDLTMEIDLTQIRAELGAKALKNKSGRSSIGHEMIVVKLANARTIEKETKTIVPLKADEYYREGLDKSDL